MSTPYDRRQLRAAHTHLLAATRQVALAIDFLDSQPQPEPTFRVMYALSNARVAIVELGRYAKRHGENPRRCRCSGKVTTGSRL